MSSSASPRPSSVPSTKAKAQAYIGLDMQEMKAKKDAFMETIVPQWITMAKENEKLLDY